jgi:hypothetical protein
VQVEIRVHRVLHKDPRAVVGHREVAAARMIDNRF